jgi:uncharacterized protein
MSMFQDLARRHPVGTFVLIAFAWSWAFTMLALVSLAFALVALFGPAIAAIVVARAEGSFTRLRTRATDFRQPVAWYLLALGIPFAVAGLARAVLMVAGQAPEGIGSVTAIELAIFVLVIGEEIGWRSFLQPRLRARLSLGLAGVATGVVWTLWHLPVYLRPDQGLTEFAAFAAWVVPLSVVMGIFAESTRFSAILATVLHGAANIATPIVLPGVDRPTWLVLGGAIYAVGAIVFLVLRRSPAFAPTRGGSLAESGG